MLRWLKALPLALALAALIVFATFAASCGSTNSQARFVNAISDDTQALDIEFNGTKVSGFGGIGPFAASGSTYVSIPTGSDKIQGFASGTTTTAFGPLTSPISFNSGSQYTVVATRLLASPVIVAPVDNNTAPTVGKVNFRVIDASFAVANAVDVYIIPNIATGTPSCTLDQVDCTPAITGVPSPQSTAPYSTYQPVSYNGNGTGTYGYTMYVTPTGSKTPVANWSGGFQLPEIGSVSVGSIRTMVLVDNPGAQTMSSTPILLTDLN
jgi:Domain of unknown function (DUF4397)